MQKIAIKHLLCLVLWCPLIIPSMVLADEACVALGALVYDDWTKTESGGSGVLPAGEKNSGYVRCATCHGWDRLGMDGAYSRRARTATRPNTGAGDGDTSSRNIDTGSFGKHAPITAAMILHKGTGRQITEGTGSWVELDKSRSAANIAAYQRGYTLGNQHPDYSGLLSERQLTCLVEFLNNKGTQPDKFFKKILSKATPIVFQLPDSANEQAGRNYYVNQCIRCHGEPDNDQSKTSAAAPKGGFVTYLNSDGRFSEFAQRVLNGLPNTEMNRHEYGNPSVQDVVNLMKYLQVYSKLPTQDKCGLSKPVLAGSTTLHVPRVTVPVTTGEMDAWATLRYAPELSTKGNFVFELADAAKNFGLCL